MRKYAEGITCVEHYMTGGTAVESGHRDQTRKALLDAEPSVLDAKSCSDCNSTTTANCAAKSGYVSCSCKPGYVGDGWNCTIMEFCDTSPCCPDGYSWDNKQKLCVDIDECASPTLNKCSPTDTCVNQNGTYLCNRNRNAPCGRSEDSHCTSEHDCLRISGETQCADPCYNYQQVNGANRLANISSTGRFPTDRNLFGWYRYVGTGSSLKEGCVGPLKCGSLEPYTLGGSHPKIGDGIQMVPLLINSVASGCYNGPNISVKACPGGHYVYKFCGSLKFDVYCTGETTTPTTTTTTTPTTTPTTTTTTTTTTPTTTPTTPTTTTTTTPTTTTTTPTTTSTTTSTTTKADEDTCTKCVTQCKYVTISVLVETNDDNHYYY
ncbi:uromodulin-like [Hyperolius riggenbachi]|uniref:uromodulin-like n=1 Tax=Hyperolius riggenbachi TaxID=752182 RepID=UPI0035A2BA8E